jgi:hypothetical protein
MPEFVSAVAPKIALRGSAEIEFCAGNGLPPNESAGLGFAARISLILSLHRRFH